MGTQTVISDRLPNRLFTRVEAERLSELLNADELFHGNWRAKDLMLNSQHRLFLAFERDPRAGTLCHLVEIVIDD